MVYVVVYWDLWDFSTEHVHDHAQLMNLIQMEIVFAFQLSHETLKAFALKHVDWMNSSKAQNVFAFLALWEMSMGFATSASQFANRMSSWMELFVNAILVSSDKD